MTDILIIEGPPIDYIRELAERYIGMDYTDEEWSHQIRNYWKMFFHGKNYGSVEIGCKWYHVCGLDQGG